MSFRKEKKNYKTKIQCYNCKKREDFANECKSEKGGKGKSNNEANKTH